MSVLGVFVPVLIGLILLWVAGLALGLFVGAGVTEKRSSESTSNRLDEYGPDFIDSNEHVTVINETDDGYGLALWDGTTGVELLEFDDEREPYQRVLINDDEVADVLEVLEDHV